MDSLNVVGHTSGSEEYILNDTKKNISSWSDGGSYIVIVLIMLIIYLMCRLKWWGDTK